MKLLLFFVVLLIQTERTSMNYNIIEWSKANDLIQQPGSEIVMTVDYNFAKVYRLADSSYVIVPPNPFAKCLQVNDMSILKRWIEEKYYPTNEVANKFYFEHKDRIENFLKYKEQLKTELLSDKQILGSTIDPNFNNGDNIDKIYNILKEKKQFKKYKLHFIALVGDYLISKSDPKTYEWYLLEEKQLLNPIISVVLAANKGGKLKYFDLDNDISGSGGYMGIKYIENSFKQFWKSTNDLAIIRPVK